MSKDKQRGNTPRGSFRDAGPPRILVVDDNPDLAEVNAAILSTEDPSWRIEICTDIRRAIQNVSTHYYDLGVTDFNLDGNGSAPSHRGTRIIEQSSIIARSQGLAAPSWILLTGKSMTERVGGKYDATYDNDRAICATYRVEELLKPAHPAKLTNVAKRLLNMRLQAGRLVTTHKEEDDE